MASESLDPAAVQCQRKECLEAGTDAPVEFSTTVKGGSMLGWHTLDARDNGVMRWIFTANDGDAEAYRADMQLEAQQIRKLLNQAGISYDDLKSALVPTHDDVQAVFFYDWWQHPSWNYAIAFADLYLPLLRKTLRSSVFKGDLLDDGMPTCDLDYHLVPARDESVNWQTMYAVYFSNLKQSDVETLHRELSSDERYRGYIDVSLANPVRDYLARCLPSTWLLHGKTVLLTHGADEPLVQGVDPVGFDLPSHGYKVVSLLDSYFYCFLSYKIESESSTRAEEDRILALAAHVGAVIDVETVDIVVPPAKLAAYLLVNESKLRLMTNIGLQDVTPDELAGIIRQKVLGSYVYDFRVANGDTPTFAVVCEFGAPDGRTLRRLLALKYDATQNAISLVSMY